MQERIRSTGQNLRMEAIKTRIVGSTASYYDIYYQTHSQYNGWMNWAKNSEIAGTVGFGYRIEALRIIIVPKGQSSTKRSKYWLF